jgi:hypothetical protein
MENIIYNAEKNVKQKSEFVSYSVYSLNIIAVIKNRKVPNKPIMVLSVEKRWYCK